MYEFAGIYYDGRSSRGHRMLFLVNDSGQFSALDETGEISLPDYPIQQLIIRPRIGNSPRQIILPDNSTLESPQNDVIDQVCQHWQLEHKEKLAHFLENNLRFVYFSLIMLCVIGFGFFKYGLPAASHLIANNLPISVDEALGKGALEQLDEMIFEPSKLDAEVQIQIIGLFADLLDEKDRDYHLVFRNSTTIGANAFALPDGTIVMTDQMVALVDDYKQLSGILLHEIAHIKHRHALESLIQHAGTATVATAITGDVSLASSLIIFLPTVLLESNYSRQAETESDTYALEKMQSKGIPTEYFSLVMEKLMAQQYEKNEPSENSGERKEHSDLLTDYFSTHPPTQERIDRFRGVSEK